MTSGSARLRAAWALHRVVAAALAVAGLSAALAGCEGDDGGGDEADPPCVELAVTGGFRFSATADSGWFTAAFGSGFEPQLEEGWQGLGIKLRARDGAEVRPGTVDLALEPSNTDDCRHCVYVSYGGSGDHFQLALARSGTLVIEEYDEDRGILKATLSDVEFRHLREVGLHSFDGRHPDRACAALAEATVDTNPDPTRTCTEARDCANAQLEICDPATGTCQPAGCTDESPCDGDGVCQIQDPFFDVGACFERCAPFTEGACAAGQDCVPIDYLGATGVCRRQGPDEPEPRTETDTGRSCEPQQIATGCGPGHVCATHAVYWHYDHCYRVCDYFGDDPGCDVGRCWLKLHTQKEIDTTYLCGAGDCLFGAFCRESDSAAALGEPCEDGQGVGSPCAGDGSRAGVCQPDSAGALRCRRYCRLEADDCAAGERCEQVIVSDDDDDDGRVIDGLGYCTD